MPDLNDAISQLTHTLSRSKSPIQIPPFLNNTSSEPFGYSPPARQLADAVVAKPSLSSNSVALNEISGRSTLGGVLIIVQVLSQPTKIVVQRDYEENAPSGLKPFLGFAYGGIEASDQDVFAAASRELKEENGVYFEIGAEHRIGEISHPGYSISCFLVSVLPSVKLRKGTEQADLRLATVAGVSELIKDGIFSSNHSRAWRMAVSSGRLE